MPRDHHAESKPLEILDQILANTTQRPRNHWVDLTCALVLSLATVCSAWCAYEATLWGGVQTFRLAASNHAGRLEAAANIAGVQQKAFDAALVTQLMQARFEGHARWEEFILQRARPELRNAYQTWLLADPLHDPEAPAHPLLMPAYSLPTAAEAHRHAADRDREHAAAERANSNSDTYVLLTVLFASVLFFGGIAGSLDHPRLRQIIVIIAVVLFAVTLTVLATMPICRE